MKTKNSWFLYDLTCRCVMVLGLLLMLVPLLTGCGSFGGAQNIDRSEYPPEPVAASQDQYRPNYAGDLAGMYYFPQAVITYRIIVGDTAQAIDLSPVFCQAPTDVQEGDIRDAFRKIGAALGDRRTFQEVPATDATAAIDVIVQAEEDFGGQGEGGVALGRTDLYYPGGRSNPVICRSVVRIMADQPERSFRRTVLHECIHAVGLWGHSRHTGDILVPVSLPIIPEIELSTYDTRTLQADYSRAISVSSRTADGTGGVGLDGPSSLVGPSPASDANNTIRLVL